MEERIKKFMEYKGISASELADSIGVQRSNVTHVLKSRNKPSFQFIEKMLQVYPELNAKWLLLGLGNMIEGTIKNKTLFDSVAEPVITPVHQISEEKAKADLVDVGKEPAKPSETERINKNSEEKKQSDENIKDQFFSPEKPIERLIVFFKDQTFKVYYPSL